VIGAILVSHKILTLRAVLLQMTPIRRKNKNHKSSEAECFWIPESGEHCHTEKKTQGHTNSFIISDKEKPFQKSQKTKKN